MQLERIDDEMRVMFYTVTDVILYSVVAKMRQMSTRRGESNN
jgi:hypothetical protein